LLAPIACRRVFNVQLQLGLSSSTSTAEKAVELIMARVAHRGTT
jgi:hypothetical protein